MFYKIEKVEPLDNYLLKVSFINKAVKFYDVNPLFLKWKIFNNLKIDGLYNKVRVDNGGYGVIWNDEIDLSCNELWENGKLKI